MLIYCSRFSRLCICDCSCVNSKARLGNDSGSCFSSVLVRLLKEHWILRRKHSSQGIPPSHLDFALWQLSHARCARSIGSITLWRCRRCRRSVSLISRFSSQSVCYMNVTMWSDLDTFVRTHDHKWNTGKPAVGGVLLHGGESAPCAGSWHCSQEIDIWIGGNWACPASLARDLLHFLGVP